MSDCVFCAIVAGGDAHRVWEDDDVIAILDTRPVFPGHTLVIPRAHVETFGDLDDDQLGPMARAMRHMAVAVERGMGAGGTFVGINNRVSQSVPHLHVHVIPRTKGDGLRGFFWPRGRYTDDAEMAAVAQRIAEVAWTSS